MTCDNLCCATCEVSAHVASRVWSAHKVRSNTDRAGGRLKNDLTSAWFYPRPSGVGCSLFSADDTAHRSMQLPLSTVLLTEDLRCEGTVACCSDSHHSLCIPLAPLFRTLSGHLVPTVDPSAYTFQRMHHLVKHRRTTLAASACLNGENHELAAA